MESWDMLLQIILLLLACLVAGTAMAWLRQSPLVGYLLAGMVMGGPGSFAIVHAEQQIESIAELGVALLLFSLGLEFSWDRVVGLGRRILITGALQVVATVLLGYVFCVLLGFETRTAIVIGAMISLSSTATVLQVLVDRGELDSPAGRNALGVLLVQDLAVVPLAILIPLLATGGTPMAIAGRVLGIGLAAAAVIGTLYVLLNHVALIAWRSAPFARNRELAVLLAVIVGLGATWSAHAAGLSPALGAFVAGMFLGSSRFAVQIRADVASLRIILLTLFFGAVGMIADPVWMLRNALTVVCIAAAILAAKSALIWMLFRMIRQPSGLAAATALTLCQVGEFAFVLGGEARNANLLSGQTYSGVVSASIVTLLVTPWLITAAPRISSWLQSRTRTRTAEQPPDTGSHPSCEVLVIGFGPAGRGAVHTLQSVPGRVAVIDLSPAGTSAAAAMGFHAILGDASNPDVLDHLNPSSVRVVVITLPSRLESLSILASIRDRMPHATCIVRSRHQLYMSEFRDAGADLVVGDEAEVSRTLSEVVARHYVPMDADNGQTASIATGILPDARPDKSGPG